jgi:hypothetical protein
MTDPAFDWRGVVLDCVIILSITLLTALKLANLYVFLAVVGPLVGARLASVRASTAAAAGGSLTVLAVLGLWSVLRKVAS